MYRSLARSGKTALQNFRMAQKLAAEASTGTGSEQGKVSFGNEQIPESEKKERVGEVFKSVAKNYDFMNDLMSAGVHRAWKNHMVAQMVPFAGMRVLDVAGGTGDIAFRVLRRLEGLGSGLESGSEMSSVVVSDISEAMLEEGKKRAAKYESQFVNDRLQWVVADAEGLPFDDNAFDLYTVSFGIRNMTHREKALKEALRVLKPGGRFMCMEFSQVVNPVLRRMYDAYSFAVIPTLGRIIASDAGSYKYLVESIRNFPNQEEFAATIRASGFSNVTYENLTGGVIAIHSGIKLG